MPLTRSQLEDIQGACLADDIAIDMERMSVWTEEEAQQYFESGGEVAPAARTSTAAATPPVDLKPTENASAPPSDAEVLAAKERGSSALKAGDLTAAAAEYRSALALCTAPELSEKHAAALQSNLSLVLLKAGNADGSLAAAEACVAANTTWHKAHFRRGEALFALKRFEAAVAAYQASLKLAPTDKDVARAAALAEEAAQGARDGGVWFRQLLPGRDIALQPTNQVETHPSQLPSPPAAATTRPVQHMRCSCDRRAY